MKVKERINYTASVSAEKRKFTSLIHTTCAGIAVLFVIDCIVSAVFRTPITY